MTVTNVLRHKGKVSEETERRVLSAVTELNYIPVRSAMQNRHVSTNALGVLFLQALEGAVGYPTFLGMCSQAREADHDLTIVLRSEPTWAKSGAYTQLLDRRSDAFIFVGDTSPELSTLLVLNKIPVVECYSVTPPAGVAWVVGDNLAAMRLAVTHLVAQGHRHIGHIAGPATNQEARLRADGFCQTVEELLGYDGTTYVVQGESWGDSWGFASGDDPGNATRSVVEAALQMDVTAMVCANDLYALALWKMAESHGRRVPEELSIIGMDDIPEAARQGLTTIAQPFEQMGRAAVNAVLQLLSGTDSKEASRVFPVTLQERRSVTSPRNS